MSNKTSAVDNPVIDEPKIDEHENGTEQTGTQQTDTNSASRRARAANSAVKTKTLLISALILALIVGVGVLGWQLNSKSNDLDAVHADAANKAHAEQVALDYATGAADMDFKDLESWRTRLGKGTSSELLNRLTQAATSMEQIITPLQWVAKPTPISAKVRSESDGIYSVDCFVSVLTTNSQAPNGIQSTATYKLTIDREHDWVITEIGGIDSSLTPNAPPK